MNFLLGREYELKAGRINFSKKSFRAFSSNNPSSSLDTVSPSPLSTFI